MLMTRFAVGAIALVALAFPWGSRAEDAPSKPFDAANVRFEQNATDSDVEVVFEANPSDEGLAKLSVVSPDGRTVFDFNLPDASTLGIRQFQFESPEPKDTASLKSAYPEGKYTFAAVSVSGDRYVGESNLSHVLPEPASILQPKEEEPSALDGKVVWSPGANRSACIVEIEQDELGVNFTATLPGDTTEFPFPEGFLRADTEYAVTVGTVSEEGNISFVEMSFSTAGESD